MKLRAKTHGLGAVAVATTAAAIALEYAHVWRRGSAPAPRPGQILAPGRIAARETVQVALKGYQQGAPHENAVLNLLLSFSATFALVRATTHTIRRWGSIGPLRNLHIGERHIHHLVPGVVIALLSGTGAIAAREQRTDVWLALPFGVGAALTLDEAALLIELEDVYWSEEGLLSVQITLAAMASLASLELLRRVMQRGEREVLAPGQRTPSADTVAP